MSIQLATDCTKCIHYKVCAHKNNAKNDKEKLEETMYGKGPNDDYNWKTIMNAHCVNVVFSCPDYYCEKPQIKDPMNWHTTIDG